jgi:peptidoglycan/LPS O-acetylase OafA/YrhL
MEPLAAVGYSYIFIASVFLKGLTVGALGGALAWAVRRSPLWVLVLVSGCYLAGTEFLGSFNLKTAALFGMPALVLTFLISWLAAYYLGTRRRWRRIGASLAAICFALMVGVAWGFLFRISIWAPVVCAIVADAIVLLAILTSRGLKLRS